MVEPDEGVGTAPAAQQGDVGAYDGEGQVGGEGQVNGVSGASGAEDRDANLTETPLP